MPEVVAADGAEEPLVAFLRNYSLTSTPRRLLWHSLAGVAQVAGTLWAMPSAWLTLTLGGVCLTAYGAWSYCDAQLGADPPAGRSISVARAVAGTVGVVAAFGTLLAGASLLLGRWMS